MIVKNSVVIYKNQAAIVCGSEGDKFLIKYCSQAASPSGKKAVYSEQKVREKDFVILSENPSSSLEKLLEYSEDSFENQLLEAYELLLADESSQNQSFSFQDILELSSGDLSADKSWFFYQKIISSYEFSLDTEAFKSGKISFKLRNNKEIEELKQKDFEKSHAQEIKDAFLQRLRERKLDLPSDAKFMGEVEAFALCKTDKSKIMQEIGLGQSIEKAHKLLIETGIWDYTKNPYPTRFGFSFDSAKEQLGPLPEEERFTLPCLCYAIDDENAADPDDAVAFDGEYFWVCIADPSASVKPDSSIDVAAMGRGTTLYIPEGASRMLCESSLEDYALGLVNPSKALAFKIKVSDDCQIEDCQVLKVLVNVKMITYKEAEEKKDSPELKPLFDFARKNLLRREKNNAISINMPEVKIKVDKNTKEVSISERIKYESNDVIQELMLLAGEAAARFAFKNQIPFPYVSQESPSFPENIPDGWAGEFAKVKCMRKRSLGITPAVHSGLGLSFYSQVTSPLRRYGDLVAHQQLRAFIDGGHLLGKDAMLERIAAGDAASLAARKASRLSETHWKLVYFLQNPDKEYEAFCIEKRGNDALFIIPQIDMQTSIKNQNTISLNDKVSLIVMNVDITTQDVIFAIK